MKNTSFNTAPKKKLSKIYTFEYFAPQASKVEIAGTFNRWNSSVSPLKKDSKGNWSLKIELAPGRYEYRYWVDENWQNDQRPVECVPNAFGTWNCVLQIAE